MLHVVSLNGNALGSTQMGQLQMLISNPSIWDSSLKDTGMGRESITQITMSLMIPTTANLFGKVHLHLVDFGNKKLN